MAFVNIDAAACGVRACIDAATACAQPVATPELGRLDITAPAPVALSSAASQLNIDALGQMQDNACGQRLLLIDLRAKADQRNRRHPALYWPSAVCSTRSALACRTE